MAFWTQAGTGGGGGTISGSGTTNYVAKFTSSTAIGNSMITDDGTNVTVGKHLVSNGIGAIASNVSIGNAAMDSNTTGNSLVAVGNSTLTANTTGHSNVAVGYFTMASNVVGIKNTAIGNNAGFTSIGSSNVFVGNEAGYYETGSNKLFIDNQVRTNEADARVKALVYGIFDAATANQMLTVNGQVNSLNGYSIAGYQTLFADAAYNTFFWRGNSTYPTSSSGTGRNVAIGNLDAGNLALSGYCNTVIGSFQGSPLTSGLQNIVFGTYEVTSLTSGNYNILFSSIVAAGNTTSAIGFGADSVGSNEVVFGANGQARAYNSFYFGRGKTQTFAAGVSQLNFYATSLISGSDTDKDASISEWIFNGGSGTGTGNGTEFVWKVAIPGVTGTSNNTLVEAVRIDTNGKLIIGGGVAYIDILGNAFFNGAIMQTGGSFDMGGGSISNCNSIGQAAWSIDSSGVGSFSNDGFTSKASPLNILNIPTSPVGLASGDVWSNAGILTIV